MKSWRVPAVAMMVAATLLTACGKSDSDSSGDAGGDKAVTMSVAINPWIGYGPWYIAKEKGFDRKHGVDLKFVNFVDNKDLYAAVGSGRLDSTHALVSTALRFQASKVPLHVALFQDISTKADALIAKSGIDSVADLRGKRVAFEEGGGHEMLLRLALEKEGMSLDDIKTVPLSPDKAGASLITGKVDAAITYEPYVTQALDNLKGSSIVVSAGDFPGIISDVWAVGDAFAKKHPETVSGALKAWDEGVTFFREHPDEAVDIMAKVTDSKADELKATLEGVELYDADQSRDYFATKFQPLAEQILAIMKEQKSIDGTADPKTLVDTSYLESAK